MADPIVAKKASLQPNCDTVTETDLELLIDPDSYLEYSTPPNTTGTVLRARRSTVQIPSD